MTEAQGPEVLVVAGDEEIARPLEAVLIEEGVTFHRAENVEGAVAIAGRKRLGVAFVEVASAFALCHHLPDLVPGIEVHAIVRPSELERGAEALSLGARGLVVTPITGEAVLRVLSEQQTKRGDAARMRALERELATAQRRAEIYERLVRHARGAAPSDAVRAIVDSARELTSATGVALYATFGDSRHERVRLAALGTATDLPASAAPDELPRRAEERGARLVSLVSGGQEIGLLALDGTPGTEEDLRGLPDLAAAMLSLIDRPPSVVHAPEGTAFRETAKRLLSLAARHGRRASVVAVHFTGGQPMSRQRALSAISDVVRETDAVASDEDDLLLLLPESGGLGAHACRRRVLARLAGERRVRPSPAGSSSRPASGPRSDPSLGQGEIVCGGVATFPHDGPTLEHLVRTARRRAAEDARSAVHALGLESMSLAEIVDELLSRPMLEAGPRSPYPLDLAEASLLGVVSRACRDALRTGAVSIVGTYRPGLGAGTAARRVASPRVLDVRGSAGCEDLEAVVVESEQGAWVCCGRIAQERFRGIHAADPLLADILVQRLSSVGVPA